MNDNETILTDRTFNETVSFVGTFHQNARIFYLRFSISVFPVHLVSFERIQSELSVVSLTKN